MGYLSKIDKQKPSHTIRIFGTLLSKRKRKKEGADQQSALVIQFCITDHSYLPTRHANM